MKACVALHNFLIQEDRGGYISNEDNAGQEHDLETLPPTIFPLNNGHGNRTTAARAVRDSVADYFLTAEGSVSWQEQYAFVHV